MKVSFYKFHGNGNDFVIIDNLNGSIVLTDRQIQLLCSRRLGIGADGLMLLNSSEKYDFKMVYFNSDGKESSMCGNGGRCIAAFASFLGIVKSEFIFEAIDGPHKAIILYKNDEKNLWDIKLQLSDVSGVDINNGYYFLDTGSPHYVEFIKNVAELDVISEGRKTRYSEKFTPYGTNVNFVEPNGKRIFVRTYERGVEDETLSCGTGVTASAIAYYLESEICPVNVHTIGGDFIVSFDHKKDTLNHIFNNVWLQGPAEMVFTGEVFI
jgi:diaminopimelate epimerase